MKILVANNYLQKTGGTENYTYAIIVELLRCGHYVEYFTFTQGEVSDKIEALGVKFRSLKSYDLILANHYTTVDVLNLYGCVIQTCHGIFPLLEQPSPNADYFIAISYEIQQHLLKKGLKSQVINNGVDCVRFRVKKDINKNLTSVLSLCQSDTANQFIKECCDEIGVKFNKVYKQVDNLWNIEDHINEADLIVGIGRSLYDSMACGRACISYDHRYYDKDLGDGYITLENIEESLKYNCSGRGMQRTFDKESFILELQKYNPADGIFLRKFALDKLNIEYSVSQYLSYLPKWKLKLIKLKKLSILAYQYLKRKLFRL